MTNLFSDKVVVITGAAGGIGKNLAQKFLALGATVWAFDINQEKLNEFLDEVSKTGQALHVRALDCRSEEKLQQARSEILAQRKRIDFWVNNAGISGLGDFSALAPRDFQKVIDINFSAVVWGTRLALEHMEEMGSGTIINMASVAGHIACPYLSAYSASKHAVVGFTLALQQELKLKDSNVKVVLVSPGFVDTEMIAKGEAIGFPSWLSFTLATPDLVSDQILRAIKRGDEELYPDWFGKFLLGAHRMFPSMTRKSAKLLVARKFRDLLEGFIPSGKQSSKV